MVLAGEGTVDKLADGGGVTQVVHDYDQWDVSSAGLPVNLIGQVGQVQLKVLRAKRKNEKCHQLC